MELLFFVLVSIATESAREGPDPIHILRDIYKCVISNT